eukprot:TRINITY_DN5280_c2_g2_i2.p1 TRINITY_DN5280_c2_g2~~TRINITY_DN5280_c2_g2_i2.p1  ORF type:complete len:808 (-),score=151.87 TRINITY_DN5280_c2_g2_i2:57-2480(-)
MGTVFFAKIISYLDSRFHSCNGMDAQAPDLIIGIDFGTFRSAINFKLEHSDRTFKFINWPGDGHGISCKGPTAVLYDENKTPITYGYRAQKEFLKKVNDGYILERKFKMKIGEKQTDYLKEDPLVVTQAFLHSLIRDGSKSFQEAHPTVDLKSLNKRWCLTIPKIFKLTKQRALLRALQLALEETNYPLKTDDPLLSREVILVHEPDAAAIHFMEYARQEKFYSSVIGSTVLIVDAGGGTVDLCLHRVNSDETFSEVCSGEGNELGGETINNEFINHIKKIIGDDAFEDISSKGPWHKMMLEFEDKKRNTMNLDEERIPITPKLYKLLKNGNKKMTNDKIELIEYSDDDVGDVYEIKFRWERYFSKCLDGATKLVKRLITDGLKALDEEKLGFCVLAGGLALSHIFKKTIEESVKDYVGKFVVTPKPEEMIVNGSILIGSSPKVVRERVSKNTLGVGVYERWDNEKHKESMSHWIHPTTGDKWATNIFKPIVTKDSKMKFDGRHEIVVRKLYSSQRLMRLNMHSFSNIRNGNTTPMSTTDSEVSLDGQIFVTLNSNTPKLRISLQLGETSPVATVCGIKENGERVGSEGKATFEGQANPPTWNVILLLDISKSMEKTDVSPSKGKLFKNKNRLGAVLEAIQAFMERRKREEETVDNRIMSGTKYSAILVTHSPLLIDHPITGPNDIHTMDQVIDPIGGTNYLSALNLIKESHLIPKDNPNKPPETLHTIIFLSDGEDKSDIESCRRLIDELLNSAAFVTLHTIHVGSDRKGRERLIEMANQGGGIFSQASNLEQLLMTFQLLACQPC